MPMSTMSPRQPIDRRDGTPLAEAARSLAWAHASEQTGRSVVATIATAASSWSQAVDEKGDDTRPAAVNNHRRGSHLAKTPSAHKQNSTACRRRL